MKRCIFRTDEVHFSNAENLGTLPALKKLKAWYNSSLGCSHPGNTALVHKWPWKFRPGGTNALLLPNHGSPDTVPTTHWCPAHLKTFKSWFTKGWIAKLITSNYISTGWGRGGKRTSFQLRSTQHEVRLKPFPAPRPTSRGPLCPFPQPHASAWGKGRVWNCACWGGGKTEMAKKSLLAWKNKLAQPHVNRHWAICASQQERKGFVYAQPEPDATQSSLSLFFFFWSLLKAYTKI